MTTRNQKGFTLLEVIIAITILTIGIGGSYVLIQQTLRGGHMAESRLIGYYLAQEGIEVVRNIRDNNWLKQRSENSLFWAEGIYQAEGEDNICPAGCEVDYLSESLERPSAGFRYLKLDQDNYLYNYSQGIETKYKRKITVSPGYYGKDNSLEIKCEVFWEESGIPMKIEIVNELYNWAQI